MDWNSGIIKEYRENHGQVGGNFEGMKLLLLHVKGAKTGKEYVKPLAYTMDGEKYVIAASKGGADVNPQWYGNLVANPNTSVEVGDETLAVHATEAKGAERDRLYDQHSAQYPQFNGYKSKTSRVIPVFVLERTGK